ncbi:MAG: hypothetical protein H7A37_08575 [Chlamydiales bacterium]|nr:hypothetical protein [Chlamydiia bacterium]MCP5508333.1 hypothetical protein [Chlamydiales bacterium]
MNGANAIQSIVKLFQHSIGLRDDLYDQEQWCAMIHRRMGVAGIKNPEAYYNLLCTDPIEFQEFIELLIVPETWFYRDVNIMKFIAKHISKVIHKTPYPRLFRILCLPCSTGEEPYSIVMEAKNQGIEPIQLLIDAVDISRKALGVAALGRYGENSFRGGDYRFRDRFFSHHEQIYQINEEIHDAVSFSYGNIADPEYIFPRQHYDAVICRHLFIYLNDEAQKQAIRHIESCLTDDGILIVGVSEGSMLENSGFKPHFSDDNALYFTRQKAIPPIQKINRTAQRKRTSEKISILPTIDLAKAAANAGSYDEATRLCHEELKDNGVSADAYLLLGFVEQAKGNDDRAEEWYVKALYLQPRLYEALVSLSLLAEKRHDHQQAKLYRARAERCLR